MLVQLNYSEIILPFHITGSITQNAVVLQLPSKVCMRKCDIVAKRPTLCMSYRSFKNSASEFGTLQMHRRMQLCTNEFLAEVTEGVVHGVHKVVTQSSFGVTQRHKASGGKWTFRHCVRSHTNLNDRGVQTPRTIDCTTCSVNDTLNLGRYVASLEVISLLSKNH